MRPAHAHNFGTYFVTWSTAMGRHLFQSDRLALPFIETLLHYRAEQKYLLHEFVAMPDHVHVMLTPLTLIRDPGEALAWGAALNGGVTAGAICLVLLERGGAASGRRLVPLLFVGAIAGLLIPSNAIQVTVASLGTNTDTLNQRVDFWQPGLRMLS